MSLLRSPSSQTLPATKLNANASKASLLPMFPPECNDKQIRQMNTKFLERNADTYEAIDQTRKTEK